MRLKTHHWPKNQSRTNLKVSIQKNLSFNSNYRVHCRSTHHPWRITPIVAMRCMRGSWSHRTSATHRKRWAYAVIRAHSGTEEGENTLDRTRHFSEANRSYTVTSRIRTLCSIKQTVKPWISGVGELNNVMLRWCELSRIRPESTY